MNTQNLQKWNRVKLGDVAEIESGGTPSSTKPEYWEGGDICWATLPDLKNKYLFDTQRKITSLGLKNSSAKLLPVNSVIFSSRATIGEVAIAKVETSTNQGSKNFICDPKKIDYEFLYYLLKSKVEEINNLASGATYKEINKTVFSSVEVEIPNIPVQKQIAQRLAVYDDLIYNNTRRIEILEQIAQATYTEWFVNFRFPGHEKVKMIDSGTDLGEIPEGWSVGTLSDLVEIRKEGIDPKVLTPSTAYIGIEHLPRKSWGFSDYARASDAQSNKLKFYKGDILFGNIRPYFHKVLLSPMDGICSSDIVILKPKSLGFLGLAFSIIFSENFISQATTTSKGTKMPRADWNALINYQIIIPSSEFLEMFQSVFSNFTEFTRLLNLSNKNLQDCRDILLPKLVTGEITVK